MVELMDYRYFTCGPAPFWGGPVTIHAHSRAGLNKSMCQNFNGSLCSTVLCGNMICLKIWVLNVPRPLSGGRGQLHTFFAWTP